jgi:dsRNA-specific ribonuclease
MAYNALKNVVERNGLVKVVVKNPSEKGGPQRATLASTTEAIVGAVWYDCGKNFETARNVVDTLHISQ